MRYIDAYEIIKNALKKSEINLPLTASFLSNFFDRHVNDIGLRVVRDKRNFTLTVNGTSYMIGEDGFTDRIYKIETTQNSSKELVPYVPDASIHSGVAATDVSNIGYYISHLTSKSGTITDVNANATCTITSDNTLEANDYVIISELTGTDITGQIHPLNGKRHKVVSATASNFVINTSTVGMTAYSSNGGVWVQDSYELIFTKAPEGTTKVFYYAKPRDKSSDKSMIDLPNALLSAPIYRCVAELLNLNGNLQIASGYIGLAEKLEKDYLTLTSTKKSRQYILRQPLKDFI